jgi:hypothetical protein
VLVAIGKPLDFTRLTRAIAGQTPTAGSPMLLFDDPVDK